MKGTLEVKTSVSVHATPEQVWKTITTPRLIKKYLMGTDVSTDWKEGSPITYNGEYEGKQYQDKGVIQKVERNKTLQSTYWSSMGGKPDKPENYNLVTYKLSKKEDKTVVTLLQDNVKSEKEKVHLTGNWKAVLKKLKEVAEGKN